MGAPLYTDVTAAIRAMMDDQGVTGGATYTDTFLEKAVETAQQTLVNTLIGQSVQRMMFRTERPIYVPALTTLLTTPDDPTPTTPCLLPANFVTPDQLWEAKLTGSLLAASNTFGPMGSANTTTPSTPNVWYTYYTVNGAEYVTVATGVVDPFGGQLASTWTFTEDPNDAGEPHTTLRCSWRTTTQLTIGEYKTSAIWLKLAAGQAPITAKVRSGLTNVADQTITITDEWQRFDFAFGPKVEGPPKYYDFDIDFNPSGAAITTWDRVVALYGLELGTTEGSNPDFIPMTGPGELPRIPMSDALRYWNWYAGRLWLLGATVPRLVRMTYWADLGPLDTNAKILIVNAGNAIACIACATLSRARGQYNAADRFAMFNPDGTLGGQAGYEVQNITNAEIKTTQSEPSRRLPYFGRDRYSVDDYWVRRRN